MNGYRTSIGTSDAEHITILGHDLAGDLMGRIGFGELAFWLVAMRRPTPGELRLFETVLVTLADHGLTPSAIATRLTWTGAPDSVQGAIAAGLLGGGSRFLGATEDTGRFLAEALASGEHPSTMDGWDELARQTIQAHTGRIPGLGHNVHRAGDPRTPVLMRIAMQEELFGPHLSLFAAIGRVHPCNLPLNGAGACGAVLCDLGFPPELLRGFALLARSAGLLGHLAEEMRRPIGQQIYESVDRATEYLDPEE